MNILAKLWFWLTRPFRALGAEKGALLCKTCGATVMTPNEHSESKTQAAAVGALLGWRCDNCGDRGGFGVE